MSGLSSGARESGSAPIRLIAIDIDGTLLDGRSKLPEANRVALEAASARGIEIVLATGRSFHHAQPIADLVGVDVVLMVSNGALIKTAAGATLDRWSVPRDLARELIAATRKVRSGAAVIFDLPDQGQYVWEGIDWSHPQRRWYYEKHSRFMTESQDLVVTLDDDPIQVAFTGGVEEMRTLVAYVRTLPYASALTLTLTEYEARDFSLFDVTANGCSKGSALATWTGRRGISPAEVMAVGDNLNDLAMLEFAGHPVVMGNAVAELKTCGWPVTASHDDAGLAQAIDRLILVS